MDFYGQQLEDRIAWEFFGGKRDGFFLDVGAFDGVTFSNTYRFELEGWSGICVEPNPKTFAKLRLSRPKSICINAAISDCIDREQFEVTLDPTLSRLSESGTLEVDVVTADLLLRLLGVSKLDFVSIDTEGNDLKVLWDLSLEVYQPRLMVIETVNESVTKLLERQGYMEARQHYFNHFFCRAEDAQLVRNISV